MAIQNFQYTKVSELPSTMTISDNDVIIVNHSGVTSKMTYLAFKELIQSQVESDISSLNARVSTLETAISSIGSRLTEAEGTIDNIITAGFNLIGVDTNSNNS